MHHACVSFLEILESFNIISCTVISKAPEYACRVSQSVIRTVLVNIFDLHMGVALNPFTTCFTGLKPS